MLTERAILYQQDAESLRALQTQTLMKVRTIVAVDPDVTKSGVAIIDVENKTVIAEAKTFPDLIDYFQGISDKDSVRIAVEAGWLIKTNWHRAPSMAAAASVGNRTGRNHETGRKIVEMCEHIGLSVSLVKPLGKRWKGVNGKITHCELESVLNGLKIALNKKRTNQDERDSILIAIHEYERL